MSNDSYTEVTSQSWFGRIGNAFKGIVVGLILVAVAFFLLFWNEGRAVKRYKTLKEGGGAVISVTADQVDPGNQGKLVHLTGRADTDETLTDQVFGVSSKAIKLKRIAEMYQWREESKSEEKKKLGGGTETTTTYSYSKVWSKDLINSSGFKIPEGHQNPGRMPYPSQEQVAGGVTVGAFTISGSLISRMQGYTPLSLGPDYTLPPSMVMEGTVSGNTIYLGGDPDAPRIGTTRVSFQEVKPMDISLVARQVNSTFEPYQTKAGGTIELLETGTHSAEAMFQQAQKSNTILTWALRVGGLFLMFLGLQMILGPLSVLADVVPLFGSIVGAGTGLIAGLVAAVLSFCTIAVAWIVYRPIIGISLLVIAGAAAFLLITRMRKAPKVIPAAAAPPPPPPQSAT
ncbi:MAG: TMEM43 family protein [Thermodesulfobacteriota bacterium]